jgi:hypothetical protein
MKRLLVLGIFLVILLLAACVAPPNNISPSPTTTLKPTPTRVHIQHPTEVPYSWFAVTVSITATATDLEVGDTLTVTVTTKSTGQRVADRAYCNLSAWPVDETHNNGLSDPILEPWNQSTDFHVNPGEIRTCTFSLRAVRPGIVFLEGNYGGKAYVSDYERDIGEKSSLLRIHVGSANP